MSKHIPLIRDGRETWRTGQYSMVQLLDGRKVMVKEVHEGPTPYLARLDGKLGVVEQVDGELMWQEVLSAGELMALRRAADAGNSSGADFRAARGGMKL